jgi:SPP1 gp7 family putative phage head morphogenesis protein
MHACTHPHGHLQEADPAANFNPGGIPLRTRSQVRAIQRMTDRMAASLRWQEDRLVSELLKQYDQFGDDMARDVSAMYDRVFRGQPPSLTLWEKVNADAMARQMIYDHLQRLNVNVTRGLEDTLATTWRSAYNMGAWSIDEATPPKIDINYELPPDPFVRAYVGAPWQGAQFSQRIGVINDAMARDIQTQLTASIMAGEGSYDAADKIKNLVGMEDGEFLKSRPNISRAKWRADMIARTEIIRASRQAQQFVYDQNRDLIEDLVWVAYEGDSRTCERCRDLNGKTQAEVEAMGYVFDQPAHPNCRCTRLPKMKTWQDLLGPDAKDMPETVADAMAIPDGEGGRKWQTPQEFDTWADKYLTPYEKGA